MRIALISAIKRADNGSLRSELVLAGRSVLAWQIDLAASLNCDRIICLCEGSSDELIARQRAVEAGDREFHVVRGHLQMAGLVRAGDEVIILLDGLLIESELARSIAAPNGKLCEIIATCRKDHPFVVSHPNDFERIDRDRSWAGLAIMHGSKIHNLFNLPADADTVSSILRLGLQAQISCNDVPTDRLDNHDWMLAEDEGLIRKRSDALVRRALPIPSLIGPGAAIAASLVRRIGSKYIKNGAFVAAVSSLLLMTLAVTLVALEYRIVGLATAVPAALCMAVCRAFLILETGLKVQRKFPKFLNMLPLGFDLLSMTLLALSYVNAGSLTIQVTLPVLALGLSRHISGNGSGMPAGFWDDRAFHFMIFAFSAVFGLLELCLCLFALGALLQLMLRLRAE